MSTNRRTSGTATKVSKLHRLVGASLAGALLVAAGVVSAAPASAAQGTRPCASYHWCLYEHHHYNRYTAGSSLQYRSSNFIDLGQPYLAQGNRRDITSSVINNSSRTLCLYDRNRYGVDPAFKVAPYQDIPSLHAYAYGDGKNWGDRVDYVYSYAGNVSCAPR